LFNLGNEVWIGLFLFRGKIHHLFICPGNINFQPYHAGELHSILPGSYGQRRLCVAIVPVQYRQGHAECNRIVIPYIVAILIITESHGKVGHCKAFLKRKVDFFLHCLALLGMKIGSVLQRLNLQVGERTGKFFVPVFLMQIGCRYRYTGYGQKDL